MSLVEHGNANKGGRLVFDARVCDDAISECLIGWKDVADDEGVEVEFNTITAITILPQSVISGLMMSIFTSAFLGDSDKKK